MARLSDEELIRIVTVEAEEYTQVALDVAKAEIEARGINSTALQPLDSGREEQSNGTKIVPALGQYGLICHACGGQLRSGTLVAEKELTIIFADNKEERFIRVEACRRCGQLALTVDYETAVGR